MTAALERILCAAIYVDTRKPEPPRRSHGYPQTGLVFAAYRHGDCFTTLNAWIAGLTTEERDHIAAIAPENQLQGRQRGFLTSKGRYVDRAEAQRIAKAAGQVDEARLRGSNLYSEDLY